MAAATSLTPELRSASVTRFENTSWSNTADRAARTANARQASRDRFERQVDPEGVLLPAERAKRAENARRAFYQQMAYKSARARQRCVAYRRLTSPFRERNETGCTATGTAQLDVWLTTDAAAAQVGVTPRAIRKWIAAKKLPATRHGNRWLINRNHLQALALSA